MLNKLVLKEPIVICDIGASPTDPTPFIDDLMSSTNSILYGFEPNEDEYKKLTPTDKKKYFNYAVGNGEIETLNICKSPGMSSILEPDLKYLDMFHNFSDWAQIIKKIQINTKKLDEINFGKKIDFFKIDVQGYESEIIKYGQNKIKDSLVVLIEASPNPLYKGEKTFAHIYSELEKLGFQLHMFKKINTRSFKPMIVQDNLKAGLHHLFQLDCIFIKNFDLISKLEIEELKKMIQILFYCFKSYDLVDYLIDKLSNITKIDYISEYRHLVMANIEIKKYY